MLNLIFRKSTILVLFVSGYCFAQPENPGPYQAGWTQQTLQRSGRTLACRMYYPAFTEGSETQIDTLHGLYPIIAFGHGFFMQTSYYISLFRQLATYGNVVIAPQFPDTQHGELADDLLFCVEYMRQQFTAPASRFHRLIDTASVGLSGHSMGGGASLLAAARDRRVDVVAPLAPAETTPSAIAVMNHIAGFVYLIAGGSDGITPPATNQIPMYNTARPVKALPIILQANHTRFMDVATFDFTDPNGTLTRPQQLLITRRYLTSVFNLILKKDPSYWVYAFGDSAIGDTRLTFSRQIHSLVPRSFSLVAPQGVVSSLPYRCIWRRTTSLNPAEQVHYTVHVSSSSLLTDTVAVVYDLSDTSSVFTNTLLTGRTYYWRVLARTSDSTATFSSETYQFVVSLSSVDEQLQPVEFMLFQNCPNPFNPSTNISYSVAQSGFVSLKVFDVLGRGVSILVSEPVHAGIHTVRWDGSSLGGGVYFCELKAAGFRETKRMVLLK
jgi:dienelactone hydrolase